MVFCCSILVLSISMVIHGLELSMLKACLSTHVPNLFHFFDYVTDISFGERERENRVCVGI